MYWFADMLSYPQTLRSDKDPCHHPRLSEQGPELVEKQHEDGEKVELELGVHCVVMEGVLSGTFVLDVPAAQPLPHSWIRFRRKRPCMQSFCASPTPRYNEGVEDKNGAHTHVRLPAVDVEEQRCR